MRKTRALCYFFPRERHTSIWHSAVNNGIWLDTGAFYLSTGKHLVRLQCTVHAERRGTVGHKGVGLALRTRRVSGKGERRVDEVNEFQDCVSGGGRRTGFVKVLRPGDARIPCQHHGTKLHARATENSLTPRKGGHALSIQFCFPRSPAPALPLSV